MKFVYYHGGPGFNSHPEESLLSPLLREKGLSVAFWYEPSALRPNGPPFHKEDAFRNYIDSADAFLEHESAREPVGLIGHSFGAQVLCHLVQRRPDRIARVVFVASGLALPSIQRRQLSVIQRDFERHGDPKHLELAKVLDAYTGKFDANTETGYRLAVQNERLLGLYWHNEERMRQFLPFLAEPGYGLDLDSYFSVSPGRFEADLRDSDIPAMAIFGEHDPFVDQSDEVDILRRRFRRVEEHRFAASAHYPHLEQPEAFVELLVARPLDPSR